MAWVRDVHHAYLTFDRHNAGAAEAAEFKLAAILWRARVLTRLTASPPPWVNRKPRALSEIVLALGVFLPPERRRTVESLVGGGDEFARILASQGLRSRQHPQFHAVAGPGAALDIVANRSSAWTFRRWKHDVAFSQYRFDGDGVHYRGVHFRPGDVLLTNVNLDGNGVYTSLSDPKGFSSHSAFFAVLEDGARRYPVVIETYEKGVRPVPLNVFLGPRFSAYTEVYRHRDLSTDNTTAFNSAAGAIFDRVAGYNFDTEDEDRSYMSCTSVGRFLHRDAGLRPAVTRSRIRNPRIRENLSRLGYEFFNIFTPVDYLLDDRFTCCGWVDNGQFSNLLARELVDREFRRQFSERSLRPEKFPFRYPINRWALRQIRARTTVGRAIGRIIGFDSDSLPKGPDDVIAVITLAEARIGRSITKVKGVLDKILRDLEDVEMQQLITHPRVRTAVADSLVLPWLPPD